MIEKGLIRVLVTRQFFGGVCLLEGVAAWKILKSVWVSPCFDAQSLDLRYCAHRLRQSALSA